MVVPTHGQTTSATRCAGWYTDLQGDDGVNCNVPMGMLTPTNSPFCNAGPTESIVFPSTIPRAIARMIHTTRKRSRKDRPLRGGRFGSPKRDSQHVYLEWLSECKGIVPGVPEGLSSAFVVPIFFSSSTSWGAKAERSMVSIVDFFDGCFARSKRR